MNPVLTEIYSTVLSGAPYVIAAYAGILFVLFAYVCYVLATLHKSEKKLAALEEHVMAMPDHVDVQSAASCDILKEK